MEKKFRDEGEKSSMTLARIAALEKLGFEWAKRKGDHSWNSKYQELIEYKQEYGTVDVPTKYDQNRALGRWVSTQRSQYKAWKHDQETHMTHQRYEKLVKIGFRFDMLSSS